MAQAAEVSDDPKQPDSLLEFPWVRQLLGLAGLALAVAAGVVVALWSQQPNYALLFNDLADRDVLAVTEALTSEQVDFRIDERSGAVMVPQSKLHELRMRLAALGLPRGSSIGMEILDKESSLGTSRFIESARYKHAQEGELGRSIAALRNVDSARVHLALPKQSIFVRERTAPTASVLVRLFPGRILEAGQVNAIVHMVASSIPQLEPGNVTVVDHLGRLLSDGGNNEPLALSSREFDYRRRIESDYSDRITRLLEPLVGIGKVRAQVTAALDFTRSETTQESYDPARRAIRSEQINEQKNRGAEIAQGIPGALSNQPPAAGVTNQIDDARAGEQVEPPEPPTSETRAETRNFELDREISHTRRPLGTIQRLSVAVIIDEPAATGSGGDTPTRSHSEEELARFTALVKETIGFDEQRGDTVNLLSSSFLRPEVADVPEVPVWEQPWVWDLGKQVLGGVFVLLVLLLIVRPAVRTLTAAPRLAPPQNSAAYGNAGQEALAPGAGLREDQLQLSGGSGSQPGLTNAYDEKMALARTLVKEDPARVANLMKTWVSEDA
ncbi:MAG: flagellar basal-body MS-ring/collar protein FliF [Gammaproteobacteria bacterium]|nr:flagellar basal-body MS-ring/collar protein FliF [Gammaproteobacteria bacterium]